MNKIYKITLFLICMLLFGKGVYAETLPAVFNNGKKVELQHELIPYNDTYYIHSEDLTALGLSFDYDDISKKYKVKSYDYVGVKKQLIYSFKSGGFVIDPFFPEKLPIKLGEITTMSEELYTDMENIKEVGGNDLTCADIYGRSSETVGKSLEVITLPLSPVNSSSVMPEGGKYDFFIEYNSEHYFSLEFIGKHFSRDYSLYDDKICLFISNDENPVVDTVIKPYGVAKTFKDGWDIEVCFAEKIGEGEGLENYSIFYKESYNVSPNEEKIYISTEIPKEKITEETFFYIIDLGERYKPLIKEVNFSEIGKIYAYPIQNDVTYTAKIILPEIAEEDVNFSLEVSTNGGWNYPHKKNGVIAKGSSEAVVAFEKLPLSEEYRMQVVFYDTNKYIGTRKESGIFLGGSAFAVDFNDEYIIKKGKETRCTVCLPDGYTYNYQEEIRLGLESYTANGTGMVIVGDTLKNGNDATTIYLNRQNPSAEVVLYGTSSEIKLYYKVLNDMSGLTKSGFLGNKGNSVANPEFAYKITESQEISLVLEKGFPITVAVKDQAFVFEKTEPETDVSCDIYIAYFDKKDVLISAQKHSFDTENSVSYGYNIDDYGVKAVKAFVWEKETNVPLAEMTEVKKPGSTIIVTSYE